MEYWYFLTGAQHQQDLHATHMQSQDFFIDGIAPNGQKISQQMKGIYEPIQLIRYIFPRAALPIVVNTLGRKNEKGFVINTFAAALRKSLGLDEVPDIPVFDKKMSVHMNHLNIIPLGIKDDGEDRLMITTAVTQEPI